MSRVEYANVLDEIAGKLERCLKAIAAVSGNPRAMSPLSRRFASVAHDLSVQFSLPSDIEFERLCLESRESERASDAEQASEQTPHTRLLSVKRSLQSLLYAAFVESCGLPENTVVAAIHALKLASGSAVPPQVANNFRGSLAWYVVPRYGTTGGSISRSESSVTATVFQTAPARSKANPPMPRINTTLAQISSTECSAESSPEEWMSRHVAPEQRAAISGLTVCLPALVAMEDGLALFNKNFSLLVQRLLNSFMVAHLRRSVDTDAPKDQTDLASSIFVVCARFLQESSRRISAESTTASECSVTVLQYIMDSLSYTPVTAIGRVTSAPILSSMVTGLLFGTSSKVGEHDNPTGESVFRPTPVATVLHSKRPISNAGSKMLWRRPARYFSVLCRIDASGGRSRFKNTQLLHMTTFSLLRPVLRNSLSPASGGTDAIPSLMQAAVQYLTVLLDDVAAYGVELARLRKAGFVNAINHSASNAHAEAKPEAPWIRRLGTMRDTNVGNVASEVVENSLVEGLMESVVVETLRIFSFLCSGGVRHILTKSMGAGQPDSLLLERILPRVCGFGIDDLHHLNFHTQSDLAAHSHIQLLRFLHQHSERLGINVDVAEADFIGRILRYQGHNELVADQAFCLFNETRTNPLPVGSEKATMHSSHGIPRMQHYAPAFIKLFAQNPRSMAHHLAASLPSMVCEGRPCSVILHLLLDLPLLCAVLASVDLHSFDAFVASAKSQGRSTRSKKAGNEANVVDSMNRSGGSAFEATSTKSTSSVPQQSPQRTAKIPAIEATVNCVLRDSIMSSSVVISDDKVFAHDSCAQVCELTHRGWKHCSWANSARLAKHVAVAPASQRASNEPTKTTNIGVGTQQFTDVRVAVFDQLQDAFPWNANVAEVCEFIPRFLFLFFDTILDRIAQQESKTSANSSEVVETALEVCLVIIARAPFVFGPSSFQQVVQRILCERMMALFEACPQLAGRLNGLLCHTSQTLFSMLQRRMSLGLRPSPLDKVRPCPTTIDSWYWRSLHHLALYCCWLVGEYSSQELLSLRTSVDDGGKVAESSYLHLVNGVNTVVAALMMISATSNSSRLDFDSVTVSAHDLVDAVPALLVRTEASPSTATSPHGASPEATESTPDSPSSQGSVSTTPEKAHRHRTPPSSNLSPNATVFEAGPTPMPPRHRSAPVRSAPASSDVPTRSNKEYERLLHVLILSLAKLGANHAHLRELVIQSLERVAGASQSRHGLGAARVSGSQEHHPSQELRDHIGSLVAILKQPRVCASLFNRRDVSLNRETCLLTSFDEEGTTAIPLPMLLHLSPLTSALAGNVAELSIHPTDADAEFDSSKQPPHTPLKSTQKPMPRAPMRSPELTAEADSVVHSLIYKLLQHC